MNKQNRMGWHMLDRKLEKFAAALVLALTSVVAHAQATIESVTGSIQGGTEVIRIDLSEPLSALPSGVSIQSPARIALDFPGVSNGSGKNTVEINQGNLKSANIAQGASRTRVVINLKQATTYSAEIQGNSLLVILGAVGGNASVPAPVATKFAEDHNRDSVPLKDIDFRRGSDGAGRIVVSLTNNQVGVDIKQQNKSLTVEFMRSSLPEGLRRRLDVSDFGTPVQMINTSQEGERVKMVIDSVGDWTHSAYQSDNQFVIEVRQKKVDLNKLS